MAIHEPTFVQQQPRKIILVPGLAVKVGSFTRFRQTEEGL